MSVEGNSKGNYASFDKLKDSNEFFLNKDKKFVEKREKNYKDIYPDIDLNKINSVVNKKNTEFVHENNSENNSRNSQEQIFSKDSGNKLLKNNANTKTINIIDYDNEVNNNVYINSPYVSYFQRSFGKNWIIFLIFLVIEVLFLLMVIYRLLTRNSKISGPTNSGAIIVPKLASFI